MPAPPHPQPEPTTSSPPPPAIRRSVHLFIALSLLFALAALAWVILRKPLNLPRGSLYRYIPVALGTTPVLILFPIWLWRTRRDLFRTGFRLCTHCTYDMSRLPGATPCPECGNPYNAQQDPQRWKQLGAPYTEPTPKNRPAPNEL